MSSDEVRRRPVGESGLWLDGDPVAEVEPKAGDRGTCGVMVKRVVNKGSADIWDIGEVVAVPCGKEIVLVPWTSPLASEGLRRELRWKHAGQDGFLLDHRHTPTLGCRVSLERPRAHRDQVMNELWEAMSRWFETGKGDFRTLPQVLFEAMEPLFEGAYEAGQDQWRDWLDKVGDLGKVAELRAEKMAALHGGVARPKFGKWWVGSDD